MPGFPQYIAVIENAEDTRDLICSTLMAEGCAVHAASSALEGFRLVMATLPELVLLETALPGMSGTDICRELKLSVAASHIPIILLTAPGEEIERVVGLEAGAEDYLLKPFSPKDLLLRIRIAFRHAGGGSALRAGGLALKTDIHKVTLDGMDVSLTATEFRLLEDLWRHRGRVRTREQLLNGVWGYNVKEYARTVDTHIRRLRQKLEHCAGLVETIRGVGYRFRV